MTKEELTTLAEKIKAGTATEEEKIKLREEYAKLLSEMKELLE